MKLSGKVEGVGTKFNGSLKVNGTWYSLKKGVKTEAKLGDTVNVELTPWEFEGKSGTNITKVEVVEPVGVAEVTQLQHKLAGGRDFDKEAKGKTKCALMEALLSNPNHVDTPVSDLIVRADEALKYVFEGK